MSKIIQQGRVYAADEYSALELIYTKHDCIGPVSIKLALVQPRTVEALFWYEYAVEIREGVNEWAYTSK